MSAIRPSTHDEGMRHLWPTPLESIDAQKDLQVVAGMDAEFRVDMTDVGFGGAVRYHQLVLNPRNAPPESQALKYLLFSLREMIFRTQLAASHQKAVPDHTSGIDIPQVDTRLRVSLVEGILVGSMRLRIPSFAINAPSGIV